MDKMHILAPCPDTIRGGLVSLGWRRLRQRRDKNERFDMNIEGTDVEALNQIFQGEGDIFKEYLLERIKGREVKTKTAKSN
jgi:hypothetical protein